MNFYQLIKYPLSYCKSRYYFNKRRDTFQKNSSVVFKEFCTALNESKTVFWLVFGTLLGAEREGNIIGHDIDIDLGVFDNTDFENLHECLVKYGFVRTRRIDTYTRNNETQSFELTYKKNGVSIDLFVFSESNNKNIFTTHAFFNRVDIGADTFYKNVLKIDFPIEGFRYVKFLDNDVLVPMNTKEFLETHYGPDYMKPNKNWKLTDSYKGIVLKETIGLKL